MVKSSPVPRAAAPDPSGLRPHTQCPLLHSASLVTPAPQALDRRPAHTPPAPPQPPSQRAFMRPGASRFPRSSLPCSPLLSLRLPLFLVPGVQPGGKLGAQRRLDQGNGRVRPEQEPDAQRWRHWGWSEDTQSSPRAWSQEEGLIECQAWPGAGSRQGEVGEVGKGTDWRPGDGAIFFSLCTPASLCENGHSSRTCCKDGNWLCI